MTDAELGLDAIATEEGTDKRSALHGYTRVYERLWGGMRHDALSILEIGVQYGASLRMWGRYFPAASVTGVDVDPSCAAQPVGRASVVIGDATSPDTAAKLAGPFDIVIDDGMHLPTQQVSSFALYWPKVKPGGWYVIEDLHTMYWRHYTEGEVDQLGRWLRERIDDLNARGGFEFANLGPPSDTESISFYRSLVVFGKA